jgi:putative ubiquitin-RnfH superfamily antitoxin RatB of RatAB toxin-antitoxin module
MTIRIEVVYALPERQWTIALDLPAGATVRDALCSREIGKLPPEAGRLGAPVGIWGRVATLDTPLRDRDRVEIYRPLQADAKALRRQRARRPPGK